MTATGRVRKYYCRNQRQHRDPGHPLAAQLSGIVPVSTTAEPLSWGRPAPSATIVASATTDAAKATVFGYESGAIMATRIAPARRVSLFL